ncbi:PAS domain S-box protein [Halorientalis marina]|uniref:PAS domain S-box protein n=1 Tax=Halorientalis marina TaxID=2931976 RepID=UPI003FEFEF23
MRNFQFPNIVNEPSSISVLHVDDDPDFADLAADMLEREDERITVETATSASEGSERLADATDEFDCIVSDYQMPGQNGIEFLETLRENHPNLPFILFTGKGSEEVASDAISAGITDYLQKGSGTEQYTVLANRIRNAVEKRQSERARQRHLEAIETAHEGISILNEDDQFLYVNEAYADLYGYDPDEMVGEHWELIYPADEVETARQTILPEVKDTGFWHGTTTGLRADGSTFREDHRVATTEHGELVCTVRDMTERQERQQELEQTHTVLRTVVEHLPMGVLVENTERDVLMANDQLGKTLGVPLDSDDLIGRDCDAAAEELQDLFADPEGFIDGIRTRIEQREPVYNGELALADGRVLERDYVPYSLPDGEANLWLYRDITDRKQREQELTTRAKAMDTAIDGMALLNDDEEYVYVNEAHADIYGYDDPEVFLGETWRMCYDDEEIERFEKDIIPALSEEGSWRGEVTGRCKDGSTFPQELSLTATDDGGIICVVRDITEREEHEDALEELHSATRDLMTATTTEEVATRASETATRVLDQPMNGIHRYNAEADALAPVAWADKTENLLDGSPPALPIDDSLAGQTYRTGETQGPADVREADETFDPETPFRSEYILPLGGYGVFILSAPESDVFDATDEALADVFAANVEVALDHVEQRQQLQRERDRLDEFASIISHDLRSPLNVATTRLELAQSECDSDHLDDVAQAHDRMDALIDDVLTLAQEGEQVDELEAVDLADTIDDCWRNVEIDEATLVTETEQVIHADSSRLKQLLENLFRNAVEHGGETVTVTVGNLVDGQGFYVADDGSGIPEGERDEVFDAGYSTIDDGTGFGLSIVQEIAEAHGWDISVANSETGGARFKITGVETIGE